MASPSLRQLNKVISPRKSISPLKVAGLVTRRFSGENYENYLTVPRLESSLVTPPRRLAQSNQSFQLSPTITGQSKYGGFSTQKRRRLVFFNEEETKECREVAHVQDVPSVDSPIRGKLLQKGLDCHSRWCVLGKGSFGTVVRAKYKHKYVAVKIIAKDQKQAVSSLDREVNAVALRHPNIVQVFQVITEPKSKYGLVLMEQCCSVNLQQLIDDSRISINNIKKIRYLLDVSRALEYCHGHGILHLDVKPKNILVDNTNDSCKLCDFGNSVNISITDTSKVYMHQGTIKYTAPELLRGQEATDKADVYSLGITMWQLLHHETPYPGENVHIVAYKDNELGLLVMDVSVLQDECYADIYEKCWQGNPEERPHISEVVVSENYRPHSVSVLQDECYADIYEKCWQGNPEERPHISEVVRRLKQLVSD